MNTHSEAGASAQSGPVSVTAPGPVSFERLLSALVGLEDAAEWAVQQDNAAVSAVLQTAREVAQSVIRDAGSMASRRAALMDRLLKSEGLALGELAAHNVVKTTDTLTGAYLEAKAFKRLNQAYDLKPLDGGNAIDWAGLVGDADAACDATAAPRVGVIFTSEGNFLEVGGGLYPVNGLKDVGHVSAGDVVFLHFVGKYLAKVAKGVMSERGRSGTDMVGGA